MKGWVIGVSTVAGAIAFTVMPVDAVPRRLRFDDLGALRSLLCLLPSAVCAAQVCHCDFFGLGVTHTDDAHW